MTKTDGLEKDIRNYLKEELVRRRSRNPNYSIRAFANFLGISDSFLSKILRGKNLVSHAMLLELGKRLNLDATKLNKFGEVLKKTRAKKYRNRFMCL
jgi:transcriptional regulator with XRE-family HTH domain